MTTVPLTSPDRPPAVLRQTLALLHDAYRELNSKRMFWISLILSGVAMGAFGVIAVTKYGLTFAGYDWESSFIPPKSQYKFLFSSMMIDWWLTWAVLVLAIISTAGIFPDFLSGGSIDLFISKPIGRLRLFITKYFTGMLFAFLQVSIFSVVAFFVMGMRGKMWEPRLFLAIPIVLCLFSYLYAISVLLGVITRSTIATLLLTVLLWAIIGGMHFSEVRLQALRNIYARRIETIDQDLAAMDAAPPTTRASQNAASSSMVKSMQDMLGIHSPTSVRSPERENLVAHRQTAVSGEHFFTTWHRVAYPIHVILPKTSETSDLLDHAIMSSDEYLEILSGRREEIQERFRRQVREQDMFLINDEIDTIRRSRSTVGILASSLAFEACILGIAAWMFCRRDF